MKKKKIIKRTTIIKSFIGYLIINQDYNPLYSDSNGHLSIFHKEEDAFKHLRKHWITSIVNLLLGKKRKIVKAAVTYEIEINY